MPADVIRSRYNRLVELVNEIAWEENKRLVGTTVELMVSEGEGRKDAATHRLSGRGPDNRLVHFNPDVSLVEGALWRPLETRRPARRPGHRRDHQGGPAPPGRGRRGAGAAPYPLGRCLGGAHLGAQRPGASVLGMPVLGVPAPPPAAPACG